MYKLFLSTLAAVLVAGAGSFTARAQQPENAVSGGSAMATGRIGFVDIDRITTKAKQSSAMDKVSGEVKRLQRDYQQRLDKVRDLERDIDKTRGVVSADETARKQKEVGRLKNELDELELRAKRELQKLDDTVFEPLVKQIGYAIEDVAKERQFDIVLRGEAVFYGSPAVDLTEDVIRKLDLEGRQTTGTTTVRNSTAQQEPKKEDLRPAFTDEPPSSTPTPPASKSEKASEDASAKPKAPRVRPVDRQAE